MDKRELRLQFRALREQMRPSEVQAASEALCARLAEWPVLAQARIVLAYLAFRNELDLLALVEHVPHICWTVPRVEGADLIPHLYDPACLVRHRFGMLEPACYLETVEPAAIDVVLVPGVAFDRHGGRLGFGGGFYDRFLPGTPAQRVGVTYDCCLVDELPIAEYDQCMDWIVTPTQLWCCPDRTELGLSRQQHHLE